MLNTPPTFGWYLAGLVFKWLKAAGGLEARGRFSSARREATGGRRAHANVAPPLLRAEVSPRRPRLRSMRRAATAAGSA